MLFIYDALSVGGIETFFVRMAKERKKNGLITKILLTAPLDKSDRKLLDEIKEYADVYSLDDIFKASEKFSRFFLLIAPLNLIACRDALFGVEHIHTANGLHALLANRLIGAVDRRMILTVGFYHSLEFSWGRNRRLPVYEVISRKFVLELLPKKNLYTFSQTIIDFYGARLNVDLSEAKIFRIGVVERPSLCIKQEKQYTRNELKICSVGRLVDFKSYNLWMIYTVSDLKKKGYDVLYDIYGEGPLKQEIYNKIVELDLLDCVQLKGSIPYDQFDTVVSKYDLFVGSGTAIIQASSLGVCSLIGIESIEEALTYGYFCDFSEIDYNVNSEASDKISVLEIIERYISLDISEKSALAKKHTEAMEAFYMDNCLAAFDDRKSLEFVSSYQIKNLTYTISYLFTRFVFKIKGKDYYKYARTP